MSAFPRLRTALLPAAALTVGLLLSACGGSVPGVASVAPVAAPASVVESPAVDSGIATDGSSASETAAPPVTPPVTAAVAVAELGDLGEVLVDAAGLTLYGFTDDVDGIPTCVDACLNAWPAMLVTGPPAVPAGVDPALFSVVERPGGGTQLKVGAWPVYYYAGDGAPGDANGQGVGGKWFALKSDGTLAEPDSGTPTSAAGSSDGPDSGSAETVPVETAAAEVPATPAGPVVNLASVDPFGEIMVGANGLTLYAFTNDTPTSTACVDACATAWPPLTVEPGFAISGELAASGVSTLTRPDGSLQLVMGKWPLYFYAGDGAPGEANGQGVGGTWFVVNAQCALVKTG